MDNNSMRYLVHFCLIAISLALAGLIFIISHEGMWIHWPWVKVFFSVIEEKLPSYYKYIATLFPYFIYLAYLALLLLISKTSIIFINKYLDQSTIEKKTTCNIEQANDLYLPMYLGYAFVSISLPTLKSFILFFILMLVILSRTRLFYFNPIFLVLGYKFYFITNNDSSKILLISTKELKTLENLFEDSQNIQQNEIVVSKINEYTFLMLNTQIKDK